MSSLATYESGRIAFDPDDAAAFLQKIKGAVSADATALLVVDMRQVAYAGPEVLETLRAALEVARQAGRELWLDHVVSDVYKALQLAKLGPLFSRVHRGLGG